MTKNEIVHKISEEKKSKSSYLYKEVIDLIHSVGYETMNNPSKVKTGDIFIAVGSSKKRPHIVIALRNNEVVACAMTSSMNKYTAIKAPDRFKENQFITAHAGVFPKDFVKQNYIRSYDGDVPVREIRKAVRERLRL